MTLKNVMKRCWAHNRSAAVTVLCIGLAAAAACPARVARAADTEIIHNEQQLDLFTGEPTLPVEDKPEIRLSEYCTYDKNGQQYVYQYGDTEDTIERTVYATVADGMFTNNPVTLTWSEPLVCKVYRNGYEVDYQSGGMLSEAGFYQTLITDSTGTEEYSIGFCIISKYTNAANYKIPDGFKVEEVSLDGTPQLQSDGLVRLGSEGTYHIVLHTMEGDVRTSVDLTVDHTAPVLALAEVDENGIAKSAVDVSDAEPGAQMYCTIDGTEYKVGRRLTQPGNYRLTIQDEAGNTTEYVFTIRMYFTISTVVLILLLVAALGSLTAYIVISRKRITVR